MSTTIQIKRSSTASAVPLSGDLAVGELAVNLADKRLFAKQADGTIIELSTNPTDLDAATLRIDGVEITASATELNSLDGLTATTAELNILDGVTATATEINVLDGFTGSTAELNLLDGVTATTAELNYTDGVTSNIQTQLNSKAATTTSPTITLAGDLSGSATLTNLGSATLTATVADDSHNHVISNVDGLQTALDSKANLSGANFTGSVDVTGTITADGLAVDGLPTVELTATDGTLTSFDASDSTTLKVSARITGQNFSNLQIASDALRNQYIWNNYANADLIIGKRGSVGGSNKNTSALKVANNGDVSFYEDTGTTAKMVWDASAESLGIGTASPSQKLDVEGDIKVSGAVIADGTSTFLKSTNDSVSTLAGGNASNAGANYTMFGGTHPTLANVHRWRSGGSEVMRIDSSGTLLVGKTTNSVDIAGGLVRSNGQISACADNDWVSSFARNSTDGEIALFRKDGITVGSIGSSGGQLKVTSESNLVLENDARILSFGSTALAGAGSGNDAVIDLGTYNRRFKDLYLSGGVYLGGTGAANKLDDYEEGSWIPVISGASGFSAATIGSIDAKYTKVGRLVTLSFEFVLTSSTGNVAVDDSVILSSTCLPFTPTYNGHSTGVCGIQEAIATGGDTAMGYIGISGANTVVMIIHSVKGSAPRGTGVVGGTFSYETNS